MKYSLILGIMLLSMSAKTTLAGCGDGCTNVCTASDYCCMKVEVGKVKKYCWEVECKKICIPPVRFPWQKCCDTDGCGDNCGSCDSGRAGCLLKCKQSKCRIRCVKFLKKKEYECEKKSYSWNVFRKFSCCD